MKWMKNSNVITVTKSVTSIDSVVTRYLLSSKSEGVTIDGEIWSDVKPYPTSDRKYVWAYETYYYTDRTTGSTQPYIVDTYQSPRFEVTFSSDSYEVHPRWNSDSYFEFSISLLNGLTGTPQFVMVSSSRGIGVPVLDENAGKYLISIANSLDTATSFTFKIIIKDCVETFTIYGKMVDSEAKYIGVVSALPNPEESIDMDYCFLLQSEDDTTGSLYVFSGSLNGWRQINSQDISISDSEKSLMYSVAMKDILEKIPKGSSVFSEFGYFDTIISRLITADYISSKDIKSQNFSRRSKGYRLTSSTGKLEAVDAELSGDISSDTMCSSYAESLASSELSVSSESVEVQYFGEPRTVNAIRIDSLNALTVCGVYIFDGGSIVRGSTTLTASEDSPFYVIKKPYISSYNDNEEAFSIEVRTSSDEYGLYMGMLYLYPDDNSIYLHDQGSSDPFTLTLSNPRKALLASDILPITSPSGAFSIGSNTCAFSNVDIGSKGCSFNNIYCYQLNSYFQDVFQVIANRVSTAYTATAVLQERSEGFGVSLLSNMDLASNVSINGTTKGTHIGNVNSQDTANSYDVWGAVFN